MGASILLSILIFLEDLGFHGTVSGPNPVIGL